MTTLTRNPTRRFPWRPSTIAFIGAGLLTADRLRWLPEAWTGATTFTGVALLAVAFWLVRPRGTRRREVEVLSLPPRLLRKRSL
ncbi:MAG TPA: hypothetical protein VM240_04740 [Verrucomicrobiae bacterium]|nr:hypothetical protein [Verrucomicrobiae bacterium]